jgi:hypothetical protein
MESEKKDEISFLKTDDNKIINEACITWVKKMNECLFVCTKTNGCYQHNTHKVCKSNSFESYQQLNKYFFKEE